MASLMQSLLQVALCLETGPKLSTFSLCPSPALFSSRQNLPSPEAQKMTSCSGGASGLSLDHVSPFVSVIKLFLFTLTPQSAPLVHGLWDFQGLQRQSFVPQPPVGVHLEVRNGL